MSRLTKVALLIIYCLVVILMIMGILHWNSLAIMNPKGIIASQQRNLILTALFLMLIVVIPVFILIFSIAWRYRDGNTKAQYTPEWDHHPLLELIWWGIPGLIILILAIITWKSSHQLDPFRPLNASAKPVTIQVIALNWKWLFIYPDQKIATLNYVEFPAQTPVNFEITSDAPMNSFWIPQLGGQVYAMAGMQTQLHLMADTEGSYRGSSANLSGKGFAGMNFTAKSTSTKDFASWVSATQKSSQKLDQKTYDQLAQPSENNLPSDYVLTDSTVFSDVIAKYIQPAGSHSMDGMDMSNMGAH